MKAFQILGNFITEGWAWLPEKTNLGTTAPKGLVLAAKLWRVLRLLPTKVVSGLIKKMYSYGGADLDLNSSDPIRYSVPYIDNFFHIVRSDKGSFLDNRSKSGFFEFIPD